MPPRPLDPARRSLRGSVDRNLVTLHPAAERRASLPSRERGSKPATRDASQCRRPGRSLRGRVDRNQLIRVTLAAGRSLPSRERGSKPATRRCSRSRQRRSLRGSVDRNCRYAMRHASAVGRSLRGSVDRNSVNRHTPMQALGRSLRGSVDRNLTQSLRDRLRSVAPFAGAWIETCIANPACDQHVAPFAGAWIETAWAQSRRAAPSSLPSRERGSKRRPDPAADRTLVVASFTGALIETRIPAAALPPFRSPFTGATFDPVVLSATGNRWPVWRSELEPL